MVFPNQVLTNQFGETTNNYIRGGTNQIDINFVVDATNGNGLGIRNLKGSPLVSAVYMHTSATAAAGNPNPLVGFVIVQLAESFQGYITGFTGNVSPLSGSAVLVTAGLTLHQPYVITTVGTTTASQWQTLGLPANTVPAVGVSFVAITASAGVGTGAVMTPSVSGIGAVEVVGDPNTTVNPLTGGGYFIVQLLGATSSSVTTVIPTAPAAGTVIGMRMVLNSAVGQPVI